MASTVVVGDEFGRFENRGDSKSIVNDNGEEGNESQ